MRYKHKGVTLAATAIAIVAWMFLGYISFIVMASPFSVLAAVRTARQAEQYAEFVANSLKLVDYSELGTAAHARRSLTGEISGAAGWESRVAIGAEQQIGSNPDNLQRIATIDIFQTGDTLSRYTLQVPLSSAGSNAGTGIGFPDWEHGISWKYNTAYSRQEYIAPQNGYLIFYGNTYTDSTWNTIKINGKNVSWGSRVGDTVMGHSGFIPVSKNDIISVAFCFSGNSTNIQSETQLFFYPCKK